MKQRRRKLLRIAAILFGVPTSLALLFFILFAFNGLVLAKGKTERFQAFHWHGETFSIPEGATAMLESDYCARQAFAVDDILALQCHIEMTASLVEEWAQRYAHEIAEGSASVQEEAEMTRALGARIEALNRIAEPLYRRWLRPILDA